VKFTKARVLELLEALEAPTASDSPWEPSGWAKLIAEEAPCREFGALLAEMLTNNAGLTPIRRNALVAGLTEHPGPAARECLESLLLSSDPLVFREDVVEAIELIGDPASGPALFVALHQGDRDGGGWLECKIADAIAALGIVDGIAHLERLAADSRTNVAEAAREAIEQLGG